MTRCEGCCTSLHEGQDYMLHCMCCVYYRLRNVRMAIDKLQEIHDTPERIRRLRVSEGMLKLNARHRGLIT